MPPGAPAEPGRFPLLRHLLLASEDQELPPPRCSQVSWKSDELRDPSFWNGLCSPVISGGSTQRFITNRRIKGDAPARGDARQRLRAELTFLVVLHKQPVPFIPALAPSALLWRELQRLPLSGSQVKPCLALPLAIPLLPRDRRPEQEPPSPKTSLPPNHPGPFPNRRSWCWHGRGPGAAALCPESGRWSFATFSAWLVLSLEEKAEPAWERRGGLLGSPFCSPEKRSGDFPPPVALCF